MSGKMTRRAYQKMIDENLVALRCQMRGGLERDHIECVLTDSIDQHYPVKATAMPIKEHKGRTDFSFTCDRIKNTLAKYRESK